MAWTTVGEKVLGLAVDANLAFLTGHVIGDGPLAQILHCENLVHDYRQQKVHENSAQRRATMVGLFRYMFLSTVAQIEKGFILPFNE